jgi:hypothetical protein
MRRSTTRSFSAEGSKSTRSCERSVSRKAKPSRHGKASFPYRRAAAPGFLVFLLSGRGLR